MKLTSFFRAVRKGYHPLSHAGATATFHLFKPIRDKRGEIHLQASEEMKRYDTYTFSSKHKMTLIATYTCS